MTPTQSEGLRVALRVIEIFNSLGVEYHLGGAYASSIHGVPRQTQGVDLVAKLVPEQIGPLLAALGSDFYADADSAQRALALRSSFNVRHLASGVNATIFCLGDSAFDRSEFERAELVRAFGEPAPIRVKTAEDIVLRKLQWYRLGGEISERQWSDVVGCLEAGVRDIEYLRHWAGRLGLTDLLEPALVAAKR
ncbi:MAG TPA: hypothetical protein VHR17_17320 [Thermoanaerobaculia bacterium]|nr:hypothetical protein [Thermoanaerobaculia bacterium]